MEWFWHDNARAALKSAAACALRDRRGVVSIPHLLLALRSDPGISSLALAAFGVTKRALRRAAAQWPTDDAIMPADTPLPDAIDLPLSSSLAEIVGAADAWSRGPEDQTVDPQALLYFAAGSEQGAALLRRLDVDVEALRAENDVTNYVAVGQRGTPRMCAYDEARRRSLIGRLNSIYRWFIPNTPIKLTETPFTAKLIFALVDRAIRSDKDSFLITAETFAKWVAPDQRSAPTFNQNVEFQRIWTEVGASSRGMTSVSSVHTADQPEWRYVGHVRLVREGPSLRVTVTNRKRFPLEPPDRMPGLLGCEIASACHRAKLSRAVVTADNLASFLAEKTRKHPGFNAQRTLAAMISDLNLWIGPPFPIGPDKCQGTHWVYADRDRVIATRWLSPWKKMMLRRRLRRSVL